MPRRKFTPPERAFIIQRAGRYCEYCRTPLDYAPESFEIEHIIPLALGGTHEMDNLALSCGGCNLRKSMHITALDPETGVDCLLFHPRTQLWDTHFQWNRDGSEIQGITPTGRATLLLLGLNRPGLINLRQALATFGVHPPLDLN